MQLIIGLLLAVVSSYLAYRAHSLSKDGAFAAIVIGTVIFGLGGWQWAVLLLAFFVSSSVLTHAFKDRKQELNEKYSKGGQRDAAQVLSNGGIAALFVLLNALLPQTTWVWLGFASALAAVNADTWATELGVLNPNPPRLITDLRRSVEKGTSGAVSIYGTGAALLGAALIGFLAAVLFPGGRGSVIPLGYPERTAWFANRFAAWVRPCRPSTFVPPITRKRKSIHCIPAARPLSKFAAGNG